MSLSPLLGFAGFFLRGGVEDGGVWVVFFLVKLDLHHGLRYALELYFDSEASSYPEPEIG